MAAVRDEAHRFAITGHRKRREKARERSVLEDVPGIGARSIESIFQRDYPVIQATVLLAAAGFVLVNLAVDLLYGALDPRIRTGARS